MKGIFDASAFIITRERQYIPVREYDNQNDGEGVFVMLTNDEMNQEFGDDDSILIYREWRNVVSEAKKRLKDFIEFEDNGGYVSCAWQIENREIPRTLKLRNSQIGNNCIDSKEQCIGKHLDGYHATREIMRNAGVMLDGRRIEEYIPAIMVACHTSVMIDGQCVHCYLPAIGQLMYISKNIELVVQALRKTGETTESFKNIDGSKGLRGYWWSSTECDEYGTWCLINGNGFHCGKGNPALILPLFKL